MKQNECKVIAILNHKGGVGKTTMTMNFGAELAKRGYRVLLMDFDSQANLTKSVLREADKSHTIAQAIEVVIDGRFDEIDPKEYIQGTTISEYLDIIPSGLKLADVQEKLFSAVARERILSILVERVKECLEYDYILIDNAPSVGLDFQNACVAGDEVLIVTEPREFSNDGMDSLINSMQKIIKFIKPSLKVLGIAINKADMRTNMTKSMVQYIRTSYWAYNVFDTIIPSSVKVAESQFMKQCIGDYERDNSAASAFSSFTEEYLEKHCNER